MGAIATILPLVLEAFKMAPTMISTGKDVIAGAQQIWAGVTADHAPTADEQAQYAAAEQAAFDALMKSTADVGTTGDVTA